MLNKYPLIVYEEDLEKRDNYIDSILKRQKSYQFTREELARLPMRALEDIHENVS